MASITHMKHEYRDADLMNYLISLMDSVLDKHPDMVIVCTEDVKRLYMQELKALSGWVIMINFPTRGNACLDNCLTNKLDLFANAHPFHMLIKTDHKGFVLPDGTKLKPTFGKVLVRDCREHWKQSFYLSLTLEYWQEVVPADNVDIRIMEDKPCSLMEKCIPRRSVRMSSRDPSWMFPLVVYA